MVMRPGRSETRVPTPDTNAYRLSEATEHELRMLAEALRVAGELCEAVDDEISEVAPGRIGALFHVLGEHAVTLIDEARFAAIIRESTKRWAR